MIEKDSNQFDEIITNQLLAPSKLPPGIRRNEIRHTALEHNSGRVIDLNELRNTAEALFGNGVSSDEQLQRAHITASFFKLLDEDVQRGIIEGTLTCSIDYVGNMAVTQKK